MKTIISKTIATAAVALLFSLNLSAATLTVDHLSDTTKKSKMDKMDKKKMDKMEKKKMARDTGKMSKMSTPGKM